MKPFRAPAAIFWTALVLRLLCIFIGHTYRIRIDNDHFYFGFEAGRIARSLVNGQGYANPFNGLSGATAWLPPLYPLLMALAFKLFGVYSRGAAFFLLACNSVFSAAIAPAVYEIGARCFDAYGIARRGVTKAAPVALWSAWLWAVYPAALQYAVHWIWEMSLSTCLFAWVLVLTLRMRRIGEQDEADSAPRTGPMLWGTFGLLWGLIALSNASLLLVFPASVLWVLRPSLKLRVDVTKAIGAATLACLVFALVLTPWIVRNERALHAFIPTRANFGVELWRSTQFYYGAFPWGTAMPLSAQDPEFQRYMQIGEVAYAREKGEQARRNLHAHPDLFLRNTAQRVQFFWFGVPHETAPHPENEVVRIFNYSFLSVAGLMGLGLALRRRVPGAWLFALAFALVPLVYYAVTVQARFRHPIEPLIAVLAVYLFRSTTPRVSA